jgi:hypothetical protein
MNHLYFDGIAASAYHEEKHGAAGDMIAGCTAALRSRILEQTVQALARALEGVALPDRVGTPLGPRR